MHFKIWVNLWYVNYISIMLFKIPILKLNNYYSNNKTKVMSLWY